MNPMFGMDFTFVGPFLRDLFFLLIGFLGGLLTGWYTYKGGK